MLFITGCLRFFSQGIDNPERAAQFIQSMIRTGHESPLEHVSFTFSIEGLSRAASHQLVRHRIASYSQQSQRYVNEQTGTYIIPPAIAQFDDIRREYEQLMGIARKAYATIEELLKRHGIEGSKAHEDARYVLPQAVETKIVVTMNCRELLHFFRLRCCSRAQWEIRTLANQMLELCRLKLPAVFAQAGATCEMLGYCPEDERFSCGKHPVAPQRNRVIVPPN